MSVVQARSVGWHLVGDVQRRNVEPRSRKVIYTIAIETGIRDFSGPVARVRLCVPVGPDDGMVKRESNGNFGVFIVVCGDDSRMVVRQRV